MIKPRKLEEELHNLQFKYITTEPKVNKDYSFVFHDEKVVPTYLEHYERYRIIVFNILAFYNFYSDVNKRMSNIEIMEARIATLPDKYTANNKFKEIIEDIHELLNIVDNNRFKTVTCLVIDYYIKKYIKNSQKDLDFLFTVDLSIIVDNIDSLKNNILIDFNI